MREDVLEMSGACLGSLPVLGGTAWRDTELMAQMAEDSGRRGKQLGGHEAQIAKGTQLQGEAQAVVGAALLLDHELIAFGKGEIADQILGGNLLGELLEPLPIRFSQEAAGHPCWTRRPTLGESSVLSRAGCSFSVPVGKIAVEQRRCGGDGSGQP